MPNTSSTAAPAGVGPAIQTPSTSQRQSPEVVSRETSAVFASCSEDGLRPVAVNAAAGSRPETVGLVGDSVTSQIRDALLTDQTLRWVIGSRCGQTIRGAIDSGVVRAVVAERPDAVVFALGVNDVADLLAPEPFRLPERLRDLERLLISTDAVACRVLLTVPETARGASGDDAILFEGLLHTMNLAMTALDADRHPGVHVADWASAVRDHPEWLFDGVHLSASGRVARVAFIRDAVTTACHGPAPDSSTSDSARGAVR